MTTKAKGSDGESLAARFLEQNGCRIVRMNYSTRYGEIDIIAEDGDFLVFAEVKLRKNADFGSAMEFVTPSKRRKLRMTASIWLAAHETTLQPRFDVIEVYTDTGQGVPRINRIENAFE